MLEAAGGAPGGWGYSRWLGMPEGAGDAPGVQLTQAAGAGAQDAACTPQFMSPGAGRHTSEDDAGSREPRGVRELPAHPALVGSRYSPVHSAGPLVGLGLLPPISYLLILPQGSPIGIPLPLL